MTYKNKTDKDFVIPGVGVVKANGIINTTKKLESQNLEEVNPQTTTVTEPQKGVTN